MAIAGLGQALGIIGQGMQQKAQLDWQEQRQANLERIRAQERGEDRADRKAEIEAARTERKAEFEAGDKYRKDSLLQQAAHYAAAEKDAAERTRLAAEGVNLQKKSAEYQMFSSAIEGASANMADLKKKEAAILAAEPRVNKDGEQIEDMASFKARNAAALKQVKDAIKAEQPKFQKELERVRKNFPQFENVMPSFDVPPVATDKEKVVTDNPAPSVDPAKKPLIEKAAVAGDVVANQDPRWLARQDEIKRIAAAKAEKIAEEKRIQDEEDYRVLEARRLGRGSDMPAKPIFSGNGFDRRY